MRMLSGLMQSGECAGRGHACEGVLLASVLAAMGACSTVASPTDPGGDGLGADLGLDLRPDPGTHRGALDPRTRFFVAPSGRDDDQGSLERPFRTIERARRAVLAQRLRKGIGAGFVVLLRGGTYALSAPLVLGPDDSGAGPASRVTYQAYRKEQVRIVGSTALPAANWSLATGSAAAGLKPAAVGKVFVYCAAGQGDCPLALAAPGTHHRGEFLAHSLFYDRARMTPARWPDDGWAVMDDVVTTGEEARFAGYGGTPGSFRYPGKHSSTIAAWDLKDGVWLHGYWHHDWYDEVLKIGSIDPSARVITLAAPHTYALPDTTGANAWRRKRRFRAVNVRRELDRPGEYFLDYAAGKVLFWPPGGDLASHEVRLSTLDRPLLELVDASYISLIDLTVEQGRADGISIFDSNNIEIRGCTVRGTGQSGITITGTMTPTAGGYAAESHDNTVTDSEIHDIGLTGVVLRGGDRRTLASGNNKVERCHIHGVGRRIQAYSGGVTLGGVGNTVAHSRIDDGPHLGIVFSGNDHSIRLNELFDLLQECTDCGVIYSGRNNSSQGTRIVNNYFHDNHAKIYPSIDILNSQGASGCFGVYLDDKQGGAIVQGNVFHRFTRPGYLKRSTAFLANKGHGHVIENNLFIDGDSMARAACSSDKSWAAWITTCNKPSGHPSSCYYRMRKVVDVTSAGWKKRYPELEAFLSYTSSGPGYYDRLNTLSCNIMVNVATAVRGAKYTDVTFNGVFHAGVDKSFTKMWKLVDNVDWGADTSRFVDYAGGDLTLRSGTARPACWKEIPFGAIGLR